ncbi:MAG: hypothetical protein SWQ30_12890 [Thermodesulfobacteriota bacterium]|nr:hypothetical protein [Thermodesulfobacteriota bacterium]
MAAQTPQTNLGFRTLGERRQYNSFRKALTNNYILFSNFYVRQENPIRWWENDLAILSNELLYLIEHKSSLACAHDAKWKMEQMPELLLKALESNGMLRQKLPFVHSTIIVDRPWHECENVPIYCVRSRFEADTQYFIDQVLNQLDTRRSEYHIRDIYSAITHENLLTSDYEGITDKTFEIFDEIAKNAVEVQEKNRVLPEEEIGDLFLRTTKICRPLYNYAWTMPH